MAADTFYKIRTGGIKNMQNFDYQTPTRLIFGKGVVEKLPEVMEQFGKKILLTYGRAIRTRSAMSGFGNSSSVSR